MNPQRPKSNWWYALPILFGLFGGIGAYFMLRHNDYPKARSCFYLGLVLSFIIIGGVVAYFMLRHDEPDKARNFLYLGIILGAIGIVLNMIALGQIEQNFESINI